MDQSTIGSSIIGQSTLGLSITSISHDATDSASATAKFQRGLKLHLAARHDLKLYYFN